MAYKRLGDYIREVNFRNNDLEITNPMGINIDKYFMPSVANVIGTDLSTYKLVGKNQFACNLMHVGRDERIPMALHTDDAPIIVSPAYFVFEVIQNDILLPEYLMIWFRRPEFDRNAWFYTDADVRGGLSKEAFLDMRLPIPSIQEQRNIVAEYQAVEQRIRNNNRLIKTLEDTAQAIYHHTFVENIDPENLPEGWKLGVLSDVAEEKLNHITKADTIRYRYYLPIECIPKKCMVYGQPLSSELAESSLISFDKKDIIMGAIRPYFHKVVYARTNGITRSTCIVIKPKEKSQWEYLMCLMYQEKTIKYATAHSQGTTMPYVNWNVLSKMNIYIPSETALLEFKDKTADIFVLLANVAEEQIILQRISQMLLSKLS